jgi:hypothetical protein
MFSHEKDKNKDNSEETPHSENIKVIQHKNSNLLIEKLTNSNTKLISIAMIKITTILKKKIMLYRYGVKR